jgi:hypothetical protein
LRRSFSEWLEEIAAGFGLQTARQRLPVQRSCP